MRKILAIIPARFDSSRFPGKPLADIAGKSMIERVYQQVNASKITDDILVATDDERIHEHVLSFGGKSMMTSRMHQSGTDRCAEVAKVMLGFDVILNIQGDEPFIDPRQISLLVDAFRYQEIQIATLIRSINDPVELWDENVVKVIIKKNKEALYFSRLPIPFQRGVERDRWIQNHLYYKHIGIYGFQSAVLNKISRLEMGMLERCESLEQLRWLENGFQIHTEMTDSESIAIDKPEDIEKALRHFNLRNY